MEEHFGKTSAILFSLFLLAALICIPDIAIANGAAWNPGVPTGTPGPLQQSELYLEKEHVTIRDGRIVARFWVHNPSRKDISTLMGFPIYAYSTRRDDLSYQAIRYQASNDRLNFHVTANGQQLTTKDIVDFDDKKNMYPVVYTWDMTFPANKTASFTVEYSYFPRSTDDSFFIGQWISYVTHTGAFWSKPIGSAVFEYCNAEFTEFIRRNNESLNVWIENGDASFDVKLTLHPKPYDIDYKNNCIVWQRRNWTPEKEKDDLNIGYSTNKSVYIGADGYISQGRDGFFRNMCRIPDQDASLGDTLHLLTEKYTEDRLKETLAKEILAQSFTWDGSVDIKSYPLHIMTDLQLLVLRYMRNYIYASTDYQFKDRVLAECYKDVQKGKALAKTGSDNLSLIIDLEKDIRKLNEKAWESIRKSITREKDIDIPSKL